MQHINETFSTLLNSYLSKNDNEQNVCLISNEELSEDYIKLPCNHSFNYEYIYNEFVNQKEYSNFNEIVRLQKNEIKCPYCRTVHIFKLPYNKKYKFKKHIMKEQSETCVAILKSGKRKGEVCGRKCNIKLCYIHRNYIIPNINGN